MMKLMARPGLSLSIGPGSTALHSYEEPTTLWAADDIGAQGFVEILVGLTEPISREGAAQRLVALCPGMSTEDANHTVELLLEAGIARICEDVDDASQVTLERWAIHGWQSAYEFHVATNRLPKSDYKVDPRGVGDKALMREYLAEEVPPSNYKDYPNKEFIPLPKSTGGLLSHIEFSECLNDEVRAFSDVHLTVEKIAHIAHFVFGQTGVRKLPLSGEHISKTSPSGGARHPVEGYFIVLDVEGLAVGAYHYNVKRHGLSLLKEGDFSEVVDKYFINNRARLKFSPKVICVMTALFDRSMYRYREPRSYRVIHYDLGHLMQTLSFVCRGVQANCYRHYTQWDSHVDALLGLDDLLESSMTFCLIG